MWFDGKYRDEDGPLETPCRIWTGPTDSYGYGKVYLRGSGHMVGVHRRRYEDLHGKIPRYPRKKVVMHLCHRKDCFADDHLRLGTPWDNFWMSGPSDKTNAIAGTKERWAQRA